MKLLDKIDRIDQYILFSDAEVYVLKEKTWNYLKNIYKSELSLKINKFLTVTGFSMGNNGREYQVIIKNQYDLKKNLRILNLVKEKQEVNSKELQKSKFCNNKKSNLENNQENNIKKISPRFPIVKGETNTKLISN